MARYKGLKEVKRIPNSKVQLASFILNIGCMKKYTYKKY